MDTHIISHRRGRGAEETPRSLYYPYSCATLYPVNCPVCYELLLPENAHYKCPGCGYIAPCCEGEPQESHENTATWA